jgi:hypothetical protein
VQDGRGRRASLAPKAVSLVLPGAGHTQAELGRLCAAAEGADASVLELAWAIASEGGGGGAGAAGPPVPLAELAALLYDGDGPEAQWLAFWLLSQDRVYFKAASAKGGSLAYQPRSADAVEAAQRQLKEEAARGAERQAFAAAAAAAQGAAASAKPVWAEWMAGPHGARIKALRVSGRVAPLAA